MRFFNFFIFVLLGITVMPALSLYGVSNQELFLEGNRQFHLGAYQQALESYEAITDKGAATWFNRGRCYQALGNQVLDNKNLSNQVNAIVSWRRAQKSASPVRYLEAERAIQDVRFVQNSVQNSVQNNTHDNAQDSLSYSSIIAYTGLLIRAYSTIAPILLLQILLICSWIALCLFGLFSLFGRSNGHSNKWSISETRDLSGVSRSHILRMSRSRFLEYFILVRHKIKYLLLAILCVTAVWLLWRTNAQSRTIALVSRDHVSLFAGPSEGYHEVATCRALDEVIVRCQLSGWYKVWHNGREGWVKSSDMIII